MQSNKNQKNDATVVEYRENLLLEAYVKYLIIKLKVIIEIKYTF